MEGTHTCYYCIRVAWGKAENGGMGEVCADIAKHKIGSECRLTWLQMLTFWYPFNLYG